jgi:acetyltransferase-like isoleucine patch superfamily enzyme
MSRLAWFFNAPLMEKYNFVRLLYYRMKTKLLYKGLFAEVGKGSTIFKPILLAGIDRVRIGKHVLIRDGARLEVIEQGTIVLEDGVSIEQFCHLTSAGILIIGSNSTLSFDVMITNIDHEYQELDKHILQQPYIVSDTYIGDNCFIGSGVKIQAGTHLGKQCIVGANSVVRGIFPDHCVIVGSPAKMVKRFNPTTSLWEKVNPDGSFKNE